MTREASIIADFVMDCRKSLARLMRNGGSGARSGSHEPGAAELASQERDAAGILLDLAADLCGRLYPAQDFDSRTLLKDLPPALRDEIRLPEEQSSTFLELATSAAQEQ